MLDIGWSEILVIAIVAIIVVGPKDLPKMMRTIGFYAGKLRRAAADFQRQFEEAMAESEADEVRKNIESIRSGFGDVKAEADKPVMMPTPTAETIERAIEAPETPAPKKRPAPRKAAPKKAPAPKRKPAAKTASPKQAKPKAKAKTKAEPKP
jgi:sec-independent protein translocase protein TatB